jgi:hypothetical protein
MLKFLIILCILATGLSSYAKNLPGPFKAEGLAFYFVHDGGPLKCSLKIDASKNKDAKVFCRFLNADEFSVDKILLHIPAGKTDTASFDYGPNAPKGIYQVKVSGLNYVVTPSSIPERSFGVMPMRCMLTSTSAEQFSDVYFIITANAEEFMLQPWGKAVTLTAPSGKKYVIASSKIFKHKANDERGKVWKLSTGNSRLAMGGMPWILCGDAETAKAINGSLEQSSDGKYFAHKYQVKMHEWMQNLTDKELEVKPYDPRKYAKEFKNDPYSGWLLGDWGLMTHIDQIVKRQILDRNIGVNKFGHAQYGESPNHTALAAVYTLDRSFNPYYKDPAIARRMLLADFRVLLCLKENDTLYNDWNQYSGGDAIGWARVCSSFGYAGAMLKGDPMWKEWQEGMTRIADRFSMFRVSCENQSSHWLYIYLMLAQGTGNPVYRQLAKEYATGLCIPENNPFLKTGYQQEAFGPDATYQGLGACYQAVYFLKTGDENVKKALSIIYNFFNHTVAPEPDGKVFGASNFSHRTAGSWVNRQYNGGVYLLAGILPEAAAWRRKGISPPPAETFLKQLPFPASKYTESPHLMDYATSIFSGFENYQLGAVSTLPGAKFPVESSQNFTRNFNNEFIAVRRPAYYALVYCGKTAEEWTKQRRKLKPENKKPVYKWNQIQGLSMFWTPKYGNGILAMNWNGNTPQMIRADLPDGKCSFPDYWSLESKYDEKENALSLKNDLVDLPVTVTRKIGFSDKGIEQDIALSFNDDVKVKDLYEQIPFLKNKTGLKISFKINGKWSETPGVAKAIKFIDAKGNGFELIFDEPHDCDFGPESTYRKQLMGSIRIYLGKEFKKGQNLSLKYSISPIKS